MTLVSDIMLIFVDKIEFKYWIHPKEICFWQDEKACGWFQMTISILCGWTSCYDISLALWRQRHGRAYCITDTSWVGQIFGGFRLCSPEHAVENSRAVNDLSRCGSNAAHLLWNVADIFQRIWLFAPYFVYLFTANPESLHSIVNDRRILIWPKHV